MHGKIFEFGKMWVYVGLRLEDESTPQSDYGEARRIIMPASGKVKRKFCLYSRYGRTRAYDFPGEFFDIIPCIWYFRCL